MTLLTHVVHVTWELPFALRLAPRAFPIWEPAHSVALFYPLPRVGDLSWSRSSTVLPPTAVFAEIGPDNPFDYPEADYLVKAQLRNGQEHATVHLTGGPKGGFTEPRSYTRVNVFLCLAPEETYSSPEVLTRAGASVNNLLDIYRFLTLDPLARSVSVEKDCYYAMCSVADVPESMATEPPESILRSVGTLAFGHTLGVTRSHTIGLNSFEDLFVGESLASVHLGLLLQLSRSPHELELFHHLTFSAIRRLKRGETALAVIDSQSAFESLVAVLVREILASEGCSPLEVDEQFGPAGPLHTLQSRLRRLDATAARRAGPADAVRSFLKSPDEAQWRRALYGLRNRIVHEGIRTISFEDAHAALIAGLRALFAIQALHESFSRPLLWSGEVLDLPHIAKTAGRVSRLFEA